MTVNPTGNVNNIAIGVPIHDMVGKAAVVTGGARGIGATLAAGLARHGVNVVLGDLDGEAIQHSAESINNLSGEGQLLGRAYGVRADVTIQTEHDRLLNAALTEFGRLDYWVNNAGYLEEAPSLEISPEHWNKTFDVNVNGTLYGAQTAARHMQGHGGGAIVNMASVAAYKVRPSRAAYHSSKAAIKHLTSCLAVELGPSNIRVNAIAPGFVDTEMSRWIFDRPGALDVALKSIPLRRVGSPEEIFGVLLFLLSDMSRYVTGSTIPVDGGSLYG